MTSSEPGIPFLTDLRESIVHSPAASLSGSRQEAFFRRLRRVPVLATGVAMIAVLISLAFVLSGRGPEERTRAVGDGMPETRFGISLDHPLVDGAAVQPSKAFSSVENRCPGCLKPSTESDLLVRETFVDPYGGVAFGLEDGTWIVLTPDNRSEEAFLVAMGPILNSPDSPFDLVSLRGSKALAAERGVAGPSALMWVEGGYLFEVVGGQDARLSDLLSLSTSL